MNIYKEKGYKNRADYLEQLSKGLEVDLTIVQEVAELFGPIEDFDGLVVSLEDYVEIYYE